MRTNIEQRFFYALYAWYTLHTYGISGVPCMETIDGKVCEYKEGEIGQLMG
jgi:3-mercaptopyruvate sulfurtransferase SseA